MTTTRPQETATLTVVLRIPVLTEDAYVGSGCCVVPVDFAIRDELESWPGVVEVDLDVASGTATAHVHGDSPDGSDLAETVEALGYVAAIVCRAVPQPGKEVSVMTRFMIPRVAHCSDGCRPES